MDAEVVKTTVGELIARSGGSIKTGPFGTVLKASEYTRAGVPVISVGEIGYGVFRIHDSTPRVSPAVTARLHDYILHEGDIVFGRKGAVDRSARIAAEQEGWFLGSDGIRLRLAATTESRFMAYQLQSTSTRRWIVQHATGTTMASLNQGIIERIPIILHPLYQQRAIASILGALDDKIELNRRMNETLEELARTIFKSWFVDFDPVRAKAEGKQPVGMDAETAALFPSRFTESELGDIPEGWQISELGAHVDFLAGFPFKSELFRFTPPGPRLLRGSNVAPGAVNWSNPAYWPHPLDERMERCALSEGDILLAMDRPWIPSGLKLLMVAPHDLPSLLVQRVARLRGTSALPNSIVFAALSRDSFTQHLLRVQTGTTVPHISARDILSFRLVLPSMAIRRKFDVIVSLLFTRSIQNRAQNTQLTELRDLLLPKLLSGELRIRDAEKLAEAVL